MNSLQLCVCVCESFYLFVFVIDCFSLLSDFHIDVLIEFLLFHLVGFFSLVISNWIENVFLSEISLLYNIHHSRVYFCFFLQIIVISTCCLPFVHFYCVLLVLFIYIEWNCCDMNIIISDNNNTLHIQWTFAIYIPKLKFIFTQNQPLLLSM